MPRVGVWADYQCLAGSVVTFDLKLEGRMGVKIPKLEDDGIPGRDIGDLITSAIRGEGFRRLKLEVRRPGYRETYDADSMRPRSGGVAPGELQLVISRIDRTIVSDIT